ncbi:lipopolysaccharide-induced tumor necrosis factor-alpha factor homolog [Neodiprion pinetum]|uniref:Lipopolysaccharide-induced tumor necrosis factor-alpha factor homolog n=1 Tax=Neodiprion lecontei TaxID=441921 RepID=A0A6J0B737_NEOLC|nr:lipopolysaccharide-induced tumor necrosis factor-alpha factor homolog [Neodiprion lecontei]XP_015509413.1 lipopolysaccharide-induced tumor necrosis factor-alpha factor homolog [Neodiprion lecontei]XP_046436404.1 lipopolysaccharide-induced tumor necrosis factor-alpha factor homolog [Neodiprion fabricii]XP_046436405.1 lipopolysaccharide-induced tumor necrosis factor-alpha factor homolog [Neodiprion fabricii]XP_046464817.1 lipopolysaccharide-induced tumor necrosis factor-alpha factor homolog [N
MEKNHLMGSGFPPPTAPPSYDEAVANTAAGPRLYPPPSSAPYPTVDTAMPMPGSYNPPPAAMPMPMPMPTPETQSQPQSFQPRPAAPYPQQQNTAPQSYATPAQIQVVQQTVAYAVGPNPLKMVCPNCRADIKTTTVSETQANAHICCIILCLLGCCLCSWLPYCSNAFVNVHHSCPNCKAYIGTYKA